MAELEFVIEHFSEVSSTNTLARQRAEQGSPEGLVIAADFQTEGRGKPGRTWISPSGENLLFSVILRPPIKINEAPLLTQIICRSVASVLKETGIESTFKRPNDILVAGKKICGVLVEAVSQGKKLQSVILGIGLNVNADPAHLVPDATSMKAVTSKTYDLEVLLKKVLSQIKKDVLVFYDSTV